MFSEYLKHKRLSKKYSKAELGRLAGLSRSTIAKYESGDRKPDIDTALRLISLLEKKINSKNDYDYIHSSSKKIESFKKSTNRKLIIKNEKGETQQ